MGIHHGLRLTLLWDTQDETKNKVPPPEKIIGELADYLAERHLFGGIERTTIDSDAKNIEPCANCVSVK